MELKDLSLVLVLSLVGNSINARTIFRCTKQIKQAPPSSVIVPLPKPKPKKPVVIKKTKKITEWTWTYTEIPLDAWKKYEISTDIV